MLRRVCWNGLRGKAPWTRLRRGCCRNHREGERAKPGSGKENSEGAAEVTLDAAKVFAASKILLLGNESQTVGPENAPMAVHLALLTSNVVLLEGIRLAEVPEGVYILNAAPLNLAGADGSPCRAILMTAER